MKYEIIWYRYKFEFDNFLIISDMSNKIYE